MNISDTTAWMIVGQPVFVQNAGFYSVLGVTSNTVQLTNLGLAGNATVGASIAYGNKISPCGTAGANAFTTTNGSFTIPALNATSTLYVNNVLWIVPGSIVFVQGAGYFYVNSINVNANTAVVLNQGYSGNLFTGTIASGAAVSPGGIQGSLPLPPPVPYNSTTVNYTLTNAMAAVTAAVLPALPASGTWLIMATVKASITQNSGVTLAVKIASQLNVQAAGIGAFTQIPSSVTSPYGPANNYTGTGGLSTGGLNYTLPYVIYQTATVGDIIALYSQYLALASVTNIIINEVSMVAVCLNTVT